MPSFTIGADDFLVDGQPFRILSGALHYFRVHPDQWVDRITKARAMGLNTIETYVPWNAHAPEPGTFRVDGGLDLGRFLHLIHQAGMRAIVRPGPYICAEWDNGGLPAWLLRDPTIKVRTSEPGFLRATRHYLQQVLTVVAPHQIDHGGPVILVQVENEYGAYGSDRAYLQALTDYTRAAGITVPLVTVDQPTDEMLPAGSLPGLHRTASFGSRSAERLQTLRRHQPTGPLMCGEFWAGWFDHWGGIHHRTPVAAQAADLDDLLASGASVNIYMFHGGTNFGTTSGANDKGRYQPTLTSYDYDAPLDEAGRPTAKFHAFREVIARHAPVPDDIPPAGEPAPCTSAPWQDRVDVLTGLDRWGTWTTHDAVPTFDELSTDDRVMALRTALVPRSGGRSRVLRVGEVRDRVWAFVDGRPVGVLDRSDHGTCLTLGDADGVLTLIVEDQGRVNYGPRIGEPKGLIGTVTVDGDPVGPWQVLTLDLDRTPTLFDAPRPVSGAAAALAGPVAARAVLHLDKPADLFLDTTGWGKGLAWCNGFALGRYWNRGPQRTLYVPGPVTRAGDNDVVVLEFETMGSPVARTLAGPELGHEEE